MASSYILAHSFFTFGPRLRTGRSWPRSRGTSDKSRNAKHRSTCGVNLEGWAPRGWPPFKCTGPPWTKFIIGAATRPTLPKRQTAAEAEDTAQPAAPLEQQITKRGIRADSGPVAPAATIKHVAAQAVVGGQQRMSEVFRRVVAHAQFFHDAARSDVLRHREGDDLLQSQ